MNPLLNRNFQNFLSFLKICCVNSCLLFFAAIALSGCNKNDKAAIFLDTKPINPLNIEYREQVPTFVAGKRIYYLLLSRKEMTSKVLRLQTIKLEKKYGYAIEQMEIPYAIDIERGENLHAVADYFVLRQEGRYFVRIFEIDCLKKPVAEAEFFVINP